MYRFYQQPSEILDYDLNLSGFLPESDAIASATATVVPTGPDVSNTVINNATKAVKQWVGLGGVDGTMYKVTVLINSVEGRRKEIDFLVNIEDE